MFSTFFPTCGPRRKKRKVLLTAFPSHTHIPWLSVNQISNSVTSFSTRPSLLTITICNWCFDTRQKLALIPQSHSLYFFSFKIKGKRGNTRYRYHLKYLTSGISLQEELWQDVPLSQSQLKFLVRINVNLFNWYAFTDSIWIFVVVKKMYPMTHSLPRLL